MSEWLPGRVLYHLHSLGAAGAPASNPDVDAPDPSGRGLQILSGWLDHVAALGCGGVLLTPIFVSRTHGYDTVDAFRIDQRLGSESDFVAFAEDCHRRDLKVILDGVFNHVGRDFGPFRDVLTQGEASAYTDWFRLDFDRDDGDGFGYRTFEGHRELVALNHHSGAVLEWAADVAGHWLDRGADGWRLDAAYAIPSVFLASLTGRVHHRHPRTFLFGEMIHGDYARFVADTGLDSVTQYELYKAIWSSLNDANFFELAWALKRHPSFATGFGPVTFVGNHDVTRLASHLLDPAHIALALAILFTTPGVPCVYYGDELAWRGVKEDRPGGDDAIRPSLPDSAEPASAEQAATLVLHQRLIALRRAHPWLSQADLEVLEVSNHRITYKVTAGSNAMVAALALNAASVDPPPGWRALAAGRGFVICVPE